MAGEAGHEIFEAGHVAHVFKFTVLDRGCRRGEHGGRGIELFLYQFFAEQVISFYIRRTLEFGSH